MSHAVPAGSGHVRPLLPLSLAALGIVVGDIGTSPLYAVREALNHTEGLEASTQTLLGIASIAIWSLILVIAITYLSLVMRADVEGEGGLLALVHLLETRKGAMVAAGLFGTALLYGDGAITPAISVLAAVEGLGVVTDRLSPAVVPLAVGILIGLFAVQRRGTSTLGRIFGPIMICWFVTIGVLGATAVVANPDVLVAVNPRYAVEFLLQGRFPAFASLGSIFLVVTGGEALYADMGHFGRRPIMVAWYGIVLPALALNYLGQSALLLDNPAAIEAPFYLLAPGWARLPLVLLATMATIIASQALISGLFSLTMQAVKLGYLPRMVITHTSDTERGQIFIAGINTALLVACVSLVLTFRSSSNLAAAYGIAVTLTMIITTALFAVVAHRRFGWPLWLVVPGTAVFAVIDFAFLSANLLRLADGGWLPLAMGAAMFTLMATWSTGKSLVATANHDGALPIQVFVDGLDHDAVVRSPGTGVYLSSRPGSIPAQLLAALRHTGSLPEAVALVSVTRSEAAYVPPARRLVRTVHGNGFQSITITYGFRDIMDVPAALATTRGSRGGIDPSRADYFLGRDFTISTDKPGMARWRERLFGVMLRAAADPVVAFAPAAGAVPTQAPYPRSASPTGGKDGDRPIDVDDDALAEAVRL